MKSVMSRLLEVAAHRTPYAVAEEVRVVAIVLFVDNGRRYDDDILIVFHAQDDQLSFVVWFEERGVYAGRLRILY